jgi:hypothetical protein
MPTQITTKANDRSTIFVTATFTDEDNLPFAPKTLAWSLYNARQEVINNRTAEAIVSPAESVTVILTGADLDFADGNLRFIVFEGTYDSTLQDDLALRDWGVFEIDQVFDSVLVAEMLSR